jgi:inhibitor of KinA
LLRERLTRLEIVAPPTGKVVEVPVLYGGEFGPDLDDVARRTELTTDDVVRLHSLAEYTVYMIGFAPGFPFLAGLPEQLAVPRRDSPRLAVPAGSVAIGGRQTGIYPLSTPGGWRIIGRTSLRLFRPEVEPPTLLELGDRVRFVRTTTP